jgi:NAD-dependent DNA ligase
MLSGRVFVIGDFPYKQKQEIAELVRAVGGSLSTSVSSRVI